MALGAISETAYRRLLVRTTPRVIETEQENERMLAALEKLDTCGRPLTPEEKRLAELMTLLIKHFEESRYPVGHAEPVAALRALMEARGLRQRDLIPVFGSSSVVSALTSTAVLSAAMLSRTAYSVGRAERISILPS